jgi:hypothetical protein
MAGAGIRRAAGRLFLWVLSFGEAKVKYSTAGETREVDFAVGFVGFKVVSTKAVSAHADDDFHCRFRAADGKEGLPGQALLHLQGHPTSMACGYPTGPDRCEALELAIC